MSFFSEEVSQRIRYLHFSIKHLEEAMNKEDEHFSLDDLNLVLEYTKILNLNYENQNHQKILKDLDITPSFYDPVENRNIEINDLMFECCHALRILAKGYFQLSEMYEEEKDWDNSIIAMAECSKMYKTAASIKKWYGTCLSLW